MSEWHCPLLSLSMLLLLMMLAMGANTHADNATLFPFVLVSHTQRCGRKARKLEAKTAGNRDDSTETWWCWWGWTLDLTGSMEDGRRREGKGRGTLYCTWQLGWLLACL